jgi:hypothetical protein
VNYATPPELTEADRDEKTISKVRRDAAAVARVMLAHPGVGMRELRAAVRAETGIGNDRVGAAVKALGPAVVKGEPGVRGLIPLSLNRNAIPNDVLKVMEASS